MIARELPEGSYAAKKLADLTLLYEEYERRIAGKYTDSEDYIDLFLAKIPQSQLIRDNDIWIYGFDIPFSRYGSGAGSCPAHP